MVDIIESIINSVIFIFPAFVANAAPVILGRGGRYNRPIDGGRFWKDGKRILGDGKTIRGFISGTLSGMVTCVAIVIFLSNIGYPVAAINHFNNGFLFPLLQFMENNYVLQAVLIGFLLGCGALLGDLAGSFIKRRSGLKRGESYMFMDQLGFLVTALILVYPIFPWPIEWVVLLFPLTLGLHIVMNFLGYLAGIQDVPL
ncbi:MAG: CDP-2,3-bis-(O-geranylgeranyl)-sn-glycerol synthase [Candidatus Hodarchaeales archaeon]|jgi:CDP-2,3-bis-(O-geranylgeranyl)-sn-glycerol synthase